MGQKVDVICMDLSKAFDSLDHELLIAKPKCCGLNQHSVPFFRSCLSNRYQCCRTNNTLGYWRNTLAYIQQGSILGPLLFNIFLNDIFFFLKDTNLGNYADDSTLYVYYKNLETLICNLRKEFSILSKWFYNNYIVLNPGNRDLMLFGAKEKDKFYLICYDITLKHNIHEKILDVTIDNNFSFDEHINICKTANKKLSRINHYMKQNKMEILLTSFIISHFTYCPLIWMFCSKNILKRYMLFMKDL